MHALPLTHPHTSAVSQSPAQRVPGERSRGLGSAGQVWAGRAASCDGWIHVLEVTELTFICMTTVATPAGITATGADSGEPDAEWLKTLCRRGAVLMLRLR